MKKFQKKWIYLILIGTMLYFLQTNPVQAQDYSISLMYLQINDCHTGLFFHGTMADCTLSITGKKDTSRISGTLKLYDSTTGKTLKRWSISQKAATYSVSKTATVKKGHRYKLSFSGKVYQKGNKYGEAISSSISKKN